MDRYLILLPGPEDEWAGLSAAEQERAMAAHEEFCRRLTETGHRIVVAGPLDHSRDAVSLRPDGAGGALVGHGPFVRAAEQIVGFYLVESDDEQVLVDICRDLAGSGERLEIRRLSAGE